MKSRFVSMFLFLAVLLILSVPAAFAHDDHGYNPPSPVHNVPEPSSFVLLASGLVGLAGLGAFGFRRRK